MIDWTREDNRQLSFLNSWSDVFRARYDDLDIVVG